MKQMSLFDTPNIKGVAGSKKAIRSDKNIQRSVEVSKKKGRGIICNSLYAVSLRIILTFELSSLISVYLNDVFAFGKLFHNRLSFLWYRTPCFLLMLSN